MSAGVEGINKIIENRSTYADLFSDTSNDMVSMDTFYKLLMAEMSNQDPMEPMSNTEFISQMASFTALQTQNDALYYSNANYAQSLVGKTVTVATAQGEKVYSDSGIVTSMNLQDGKFQVKVNGTYYDLASVMEVLPSRNPYDVSGSDGAFATSLIGKKITVEATNANGDKIVETGVAQHIEIKDSEVYVVVDGISYAVSNVVKVEEAGDTAETAEENGEGVNRDDILYASALIGKKLTMETEDSSGDTIVTEGIAERVEIIDNKVYIVVGDKEYSLDSIALIENASTAASSTEKETVETAPVEEAAATDETDSQTADRLAYATSLLGRQLTIKDSNSDMPVVQIGIAEKVDVSDNQVRIVVNGSSYPLDWIVYIESAPVTETQPTETAPTTPTETAPTTPTETVPTDNSGSESGTEGAAENDEEELRALFG